MRTWSPPPPGDPTIATIIRLIDSPVESTRDSSPHLPELPQSGGTGASPINAAAKTITTVIGTTVGDLKAELRATDGGTGQTYVVKDKDDVAAKADTDLLVKGDKLYVTSENEANHETYTIASTQTSINGRQNAMTGGASGILDNNNHPQQVSYVGKGGTSDNSNSNTWAGFGGGWQMTSAGVGDHMTFVLTGLPAGEYDLFTVSKAKNTRSSAKLVLDGTDTLAIDGTLGNSNPTGSDGYSSMYEFANNDKITSSSTYWSPVYRGKITITGNADTEHSFKFEVTGPIDVASGVTADNVFYLCMFRLYPVSEAPVGGEEPPAPTVTAVDVTPGTASVEKGKTGQFAASVTGENDPAQTVTWSIEESGKAAGTTISATGLLTIAADEELTTLTVIATSTVDSTKQGTAVVTVTEPSGSGSDSTVIVSSAYEADKFATVLVALDHTEKVYSSSNYTFTGYVNPIDVASSKITALAGAMPAGIEALIESDDGSTQGYAFTDSTGNPKTGADMLFSGDKLVVTAEDGTVQTYTFTIQTTFNFHSKVDDIRLYQPTLHFVSARASTYKELGSGDVTSALFGQGNQPSVLEDTLEVELKDIPAGWYKIELRFKGGTRGTLTLTVDDTLSDLAFNMNTGSGFITLTPTQTILLGGNHSFKFTLTERNSAILDCFRLIPQDLPLPDATVTSVTVAPLSVAVAKGKTQQYTATVTATNNPPRTVTWSIVESGKAAGTTISDTGLLTVAEDEPLDALTVKATSTFNDTKSGTATVTLTTPPTVSLAPKTAELSVDGKLSAMGYAKTVQLTPTILPNNTPDKNMVWTSSDRAVATVSEGLVTAVGPGTATITVTLADGGRKDTCAITVYDDESGAALSLESDDGDDAAIKRQTESFNILVAGARTVFGVALDGAVAVTVTSSDTSEGTAGLVYDGTPSFAAGAASIPVTLANKGNQVLTVQIAGVTASQAVSVTVYPPKGTESDSTTVVAPGFENFETVLVPLDYKDSVYTSPIDAATGTITALAGATPGDILACIEADDQSLQSYAFQTADGIPMTDYDLLLSGDKMTVTAENDTASKTYTFVVQTTIQFHYVTGDFGLYQPKTQFVTMAASSCKDSSSDRTSVLFGQVNQSSNTENTGGGFWHEAALTNIPAGTYKIELRAKQNNSRGIMTLWVDGSATPLVYDMYVGSGNNFDSMMPEETIQLDGGSHTFKFAITGKSESSSGYSAVLDYFRLIPVSAPEAELTINKTITPANPSTKLDTTTYVQQGGLPVAAGTPAQRPYITPVLELARGNAQALEVLWTGAAVEGDFVWSVEPITAVPAGKTIATIVQTGKDCVVTGGYMGLAWLKVSRGDDYSDQIMVNVIVSDERTTEELVVDMFMNVQNFGYSNIFENILTDPSTVHDVQGTDGKTYTYTQYGSIEGGDASAADWEGLWINWRYGTDPLRVNWNGSSLPDRDNRMNPFSVENAPASWYTSEAQRLRQDNLTDARYLHNLLQYRNLEVGDAPYGAFLFDDEIKYIYPIVERKYEGSSETRGWMYDIMRHTQILDDQMKCYAWASGKTVKPTKSPFDAIATSMAVSYRDKRFVEYLYYKADETEPKLRYRTSAAAGYVQTDYIGTLRSSTSSTVANTIDNCRVDWMMQMACALIQEGAYKGDALSLERGQKALQYAFDHLYFRDDKIFYKEMGSFLKADGVTLENDVKVRYELDGNGKVLNDGGNVKIAELAQISASLLHAHKALAAAGLPEITVSTAVQPYGDTELSLLDWAMELMDNFRPTSNSLKLWDTTNGGGYKKGIKYVSEEGDVVSFLNHTSTKRKLQVDEDSGRCQVVVGVFREACSWRYP